MRPEDYSVVIYRRNGDFVAEAPAFGLIVFNSDVAQAEQAVRAEIAARLEAYERAEIEPPPATALLRDAPAKKRDVLGQFFFTSAVALTVTLLVLVGIGLGIRTSVGQILTGVVQPINARIQNLMAVKQPSRILFNTIHKFADLVEKVTPQRREEAVRDLKRISVAVEPYAAVLRPLVCPAQGQKIPSLGNERQNELRK